MAQAMLSTIARNRGVDASVASAGLVVGGAPLPVETRDALAAMGLTGSGLNEFRSHQLTVGLVTGAELILGLSREHVREIIVRVPDAWDRTYTLKELVRRGSAVARRGPREDLTHWLTRVGIDRDRADLLGESPVDDVTDPIGRLPQAFDQTALEIRDLCFALAQLLWPGMG